MVPARSLVPLAGLSLLALALPLPAQAAAYNFTPFDSPAATPAFGTTVNGLSNAGSIVGFAGASNTGFVLGPDGTTFTTPAGLNAGAIANGINGAGTLVGMDGTNAFLLPGGAAAETLLPAVNGATTSEAAFGINDNGLIVGQYTDSSLTAPATTPGFVDKITGTTNTFTTIAVPSGFTSVNVQGINDNGLAVGFYSLGSVSHGFTYNYNTSLFTTLVDPTDPNFQFSQVLGINDAGIAAGYYGTSTGFQHGFLYDTNTKTYTYLDDPNVAPGGSAVMQITGINNAGEIAGFYTDASGAQHGFHAAPAVPEATPSALLGLGLLPLGLIAVRRRRTR